MLSEFLAIALFSADATVSEQNSCPLLSEPPEFTLNCRIPVDGHDWRSRRPITEGQALIAVTISEHAELLDAVIVEAVPKEVGPTALRGIRRACWGVFRVDGLASCYRARIPIQLKLDPKEIPNE